MMIFLSVFLAALFFIGQTIYASNNNNLTDKVKESITSRYDPSEFQVTVNDDGLVTLKGEVNSLYDKFRIYEITSRVQGVKNISNDITVNTDLLPEKMIEANIRNMIDGSGVIKEPQKINIEVDNSLVKLSGNVSFNREKIIAMTLASQANGVKDIENNIIVTPIGKAIDDDNIKAYLNSILVNEFPLTDRKDLSISVQDGFVTIEGAVSNLWTKDKIEQEFESVAGVIRVINDLEVNPDLMNS
jgi:osmotically-inducible protein OsmY